MTYLEKVGKASRELQSVGLTPFDLVEFSYLHDLEFGTRSFPGTDMDVRNGNHEAIVEAMKKKAEASQNDIWTLMVKDLT